MVVCAGSPRAASTAECTLAEHVLEYMMEDEHRAGRLQQEKATYLGYWNYHLHQLCSDGFDCENKYPAALRELWTRDDWSNALSNIDGGDDIRTEMDNYYGKRDSVEASSVVIGQIARFDETLLDDVRQEARAHLVAGQGGGFRLGAEPRVVHAAEGGIPVVVRHLLRPLAAVGSLLGERHARRREHRAIRPQL